MIFCGDGEPHGQYGSGPGRAVQGHDAADAIIADLDGQRAVGPFDEDVHRGGCRVLGGAGRLRGNGADQAGFASLAAAVEFRRASG
jgi:hypothetical protein